MDITLQDKNGSRQIDEFYLDEPCVVSFFIGELGWLAQRWQGYLRHLKYNVYKEHKFLVMLNSQFHVLVDDFVNCTIDLPDDFYGLGLETDCYEAPYPNSPPSSLTPPDVWFRLIEYFREFYNKEKAVEIWTPRGCNQWIDMQPQLFTKYHTEALLSTNRPVITIFPRGRSRASFRNVPEYVWFEVVEKLRQRFNIALFGTPSGSCLVDYQAPNVENFIGKADLDKVVYFLNNSVCSISSQSGPTHISLLSCCPSLIIGHEKQRHTEEDNRFQVPTSFRVVGDYRAVSSDDIVNDVFKFISALEEYGEGNVIARRTYKPMFKSLATENRKDVVGAIVDVRNFRNVINTINLFDLNKVYLIGDSMDENLLEELKHGLGEYGNFDKAMFVPVSAKDGLDYIKEDLDFVWFDSFQEKEIVNDYFFKLKPGGYLGADMCEDFDGLGFPLPYRRANFGDNYSIGSSDTSMSWFIRMGGVLRKSMSTLVGRKDLVGVEVGVYYGENSKSILDNLDVDKLYLVDPYDSGLVGIKEKSAPKFISDNAKRLLKDYNDKIEWVKLKSDEAVDKIPDNLDFAYVDGDHTYEGAKKDVTLYWAKLKDGGILAIHDYDNDEVARAVQEFFEAQDSDFPIFTDVDVDGTLECWVYKTKDLYVDVLNEGVEAFNGFISERMD